MALFPESLLEVDLAKLVRMNKQTVIFDNRFIDKITNIIDLKNASID